MNLIKCLKEAQFHGAKRLADSEFRWLWVCSLLFLLVAAIGSVYQAVDRFLDNPTHMVQLDNGAVLHFPSVIVCPEIWFDEDKTDKFISEIYIPGTINATLIRSTLGQLAAFYTPHLPYSVPNLELLESVLQLNGINIKMALWKLSVPCEELLLRVGGNMGRIKPKGPGIMHNLMVAVQQDVHFHDLFTSKWFTVQHPKQYVEASFNNTPLLPGIEHWGGFLSHRMQVGMEAVKLGDNLLGCRMTEERLRYFPLYKKLYCLAECAMGRITKRCGCTGLTSPPLPGVAPCRARNLNCLIHASVMYEAPDCDCPKACDSMESEVQMQTFKLVQGAFNMDPFYDGLSLANVSVIRAFAVHRNTRVQQRRSYYNFTNLFSELGGMFSVYLGCSVLTVVEVLQMIWKSFKSCWNKRKTQRRKALQPLGSLGGLQKRYAVRPAKIHKFGYPVY